MTVPGLLDNSGVAVQFGTDRTLLLVDGSGTPASVYRTLVHF